MFIPFGEYVSMKMPIESIKCYLLDHYLNSVMVLNKIKYLSVVDSLFQNTGYYTKMSLFHADVVGIGM